MDEIEAIRTQYREMMTMSYRLAIAQKRLELMVAELHERTRVPPGHAVDVLGDGHVKPLAQCKQHLASE